MEASDAAAAEKAKEEDPKPTTEGEEKKPDEKQELPPAVAVAIPAEETPTTAVVEPKKDVVTAAAEASAATVETAVAAAEEDDANAIWEPAPPDVLSGRGASVNAHPGNKKFRALCFARKPEFEAGNHAAKRRVATEIVTSTFDGGKARFLKKKGEKGPWYEMTKEQAILKACQVMRDYKRPDRMAMREMMQQNGHARKRSRSAEPSTPLLDTPVPTGPLEPIIENPFGVHSHDVLSGRGAFVNGHVGNSRLRTLALERKNQFDAGNYTEKRALATEIVHLVRSLKPPGRFLKKVTAKKGEKVVEEKDAAKAFENEWEELPDEKAIHKACQVMRDIDRPDRKDRELRRANKKKKLLGDKVGDEVVKEGEKKEDTAMDVLAAGVEKTVQDTVAETEVALDKALEATSELKKDVSPTVEV
mmetsp:Transcript_20279/g.49721  ORF Transcript_20279/g.49721 Transcript_20279/m.49721 type:complete len:418 (-) Transcript_20279:112-1365(-)|eukprot:CAMPEP_0113636580 /NCGR_PEP_ID=MMETSP0017_2-20120614/19101_1 /TAXON_ID=2856 /ORGANISM="Cylindrotheca closterium" /LENGTH=417 /DNA_ID=CAMNT_0000547475 /DNA_START=90 /DNA_END=1343 /DNA_ORIENTATION=- /assembly_acc=CAM_ASM_000147